MDVQAHRHCRAPQSRGQKQHSRSTVVSMTPTGFSTRRSIELSASRHGGGQCGVGTDSSMVAANVLLAPVLEPAAATAPAALDPRHMAHDIDPAFRMLAIASSELICSWQSCVTRARFKAAISSSIDHDYPTASKSRAILIDIDPSRPAPHICIAHSPDLA